jgi:hypothetical protein
MRNFNHLLLILAILLLPSCTPAQPVEQVTVIAHPDGPLYVGDQVSFEVLLPATTSGEVSNMVVSFNGQELGNAGITPYGIGGRNQATFWWVWNTSELKPGRYSLIFTSLPDNSTWTETYTLHPADLVPSPEPNAYWVSTTTVCCNLYYITGTAVERDLISLSQEADRQAAAVSAQMGSILEERVDIIFMSRVIGHGGFMWDGIYTSYLDGNYIGNDMAMLFHHEFVHFYDGEVGGTYLPVVLQEGLAVYLTGGHFKPESLGPRAGALLILDWYIPLSTITDDFYRQQHDIGYLEAGALVQYLVDTYGWAAFNEFYRDIPVPENQTDSDVMDTALQNQFGISFASLETSYMDYLHSQAIDQEVVTDLQLTVSFFDTVRHYQERLDPSAYFLTAWLPDASLMRERGIVADLLRHPAGWNNRLIESLLIFTQRELFAGDYRYLDRILSLTNWLLNVGSP